MLTDNTIEDRERLKNLPEEERAETVTNAVDKQYCAAMLDGDKRLAAGIKGFGGLVGYKGDFFDSAYEYLTGSDMVEQSTDTAYLLLVHFYNDCFKGKLRDSAKSHMTKACVLLAEGLLNKAITSYESWSVNVKASCILYSQAVLYAKYSKESEETVDLLLDIGTWFLNGEIELDNGKVIQCERSLEDAYKAFYYADQYGAYGAARMMKKVLVEAGINLG